MAVWDEKNIGLFTILCVFELTTAAVGQNAPTSNENSPAVQGTLMEIDGHFYVIMDSTGKKQRVHVDTRTMISSGKKLMQSCGLCKTQFLYD
jgi:hypothetical protein